jgi:prepilin-type N-terminal cleavage/methylation domain-containing protein
MMKRNPSTLTASLPARHERRRGFTLVEVLVVMAILVLIAAIALPLIRKPLVRREVQSAADSVRTKMFHARIGAMRSRHVYTFQYQPGSGSYRVSPQDQPSAAQPTDDATNTGQEDPVTADGEHQPSEDGSLPDGIHFLADDSPDPDAGEQTPPMIAQNGDGGNGWSEPIFFYPDGTTSDARLIVASGRGYAIHVRLRGVTGNVVVGKPVVE